MTELTPEQMARIQAELADWYGDRQEMTQDDVQSLLSALTTERTRREEVERAVDERDELLVKERLARLIAEQDVATRDAQLAVVTAALRTYGKHTPLCSVSGAYDERSCTCGLRAALHTQPAKEDGDAQR